MKVTNYQFVRTKGSTFRRRSHIPMLPETLEKNFSGSPSYYSNSKIFCNLEKCLKEDKSK